MNEQILKSLKQIEEEFGINIIFAARGSKKFKYLDDPLDITETNCVRFIYAQSIEQYLFGSDSLYITEEITDGISFIPMHIKFIFENILSSEPFTFEWLKFSNKVYIKNDLIYNKLIYGYDVCYRPISHNITKFLSIVSQALACKSHDTNEIKINFLITAIKYLLITKHYTIFDDQIFDCDFKTLIPLYVPKHIAPEIINIIENVEDEKMEISQFVKISDNLNNFISTTNKELSPFTFELESQYVERIDIYKKILNQLFMDILKLLDVLIEE